jgi:hypothetical protein
MFHTKTVASNRKKHAWFKPYQIHNVFFYFYISLVLEHVLLVKAEMNSTFEHFEKKKKKKKRKKKLSLLSQLYLLLLQVEDLMSLVPEVKESVTEDKVDLLHKITTSLLVEDRLTSIMCVHKGKVRYLNITMNLTLFFYWIMRQATCHVISALDFAWILPSLVMQIL